MPPLWPASVDVCTCEPSENDAHHAESGSDAPVVGRICTGLVKPQWSTSSSKGAKRCNYFRPVEAFRSSRIEDQSGGPMSAQKERSSTSSAEALKATESVVRQVTPSTRAELQSSGSSSPTGIRRTPAQASTSDAMGMKESALSENRLRALLNEWGERHENLLQRYMEGMIAEINGLMTHHRHRPRCSWKGSSRRRSKQGSCSFESEKLGDPSIQGPMAPLSATSEIQQQPPIGELMALHAHGQEVPFKAESEASIRLEVEDVINELGLSERSNSGPTNAKWRELMGNRPFPYNKTAAKSVWYCLEDPETSIVAKWYARLMPAFILAAVCASLSQMVKELPLHGDIAWALETCIDSIFTLEIIIRFWVCPRKCSFFLSGYNLIDVSVAFTLMFRLFIHEQEAQQACEATDGSAAKLEQVILFGVVPILRLLRMLRRVEELQLILEAFRRAFEALPVLIYIYFLKLLVFATLIYYVEPRENVLSLPHAMWLTLVTMTTVGYGDVYPITTPGCIVVSLLVVSSALYMAVPLGIIGSCFSEVWHNRERILMLRNLRVRLVDNGYGPADLPNMFKYFDADTDGNLAYEEFKHMVKSLNLGIPEERLVRVFDKFDVEGKGYVDDRDMVKAVFPVAYHQMYDKDGNLKVGPTSTMDVLSWCRLSSHSRSATR